MASSSPASNSSHQGGGGPPYGQRILGPPDDWKGGPPSAKDCELFVGRIPKECNEHDLWPVFNGIGSLYEIRLMVDLSGANRGFAFVLYGESDRAKKAIKELNNYEIRPGKYLGVVKSIDNRRLFVGGIPKNNTKEEIKQELSKVTDGVQDVILYSAINDKTKSRGFAFVEYTDHRTAALARRKLIPGNVQLFGNSIAVDWAEPEITVDEEIMSKVTVLYVRNLMPVTTENKLRELFNKESNYGVEKVKKLRDFAFIHLVTREQAEQALGALNNTEIDGSTIEVTWAKPVDKQAYRIQRALTKTYGGEQLGYQMYPMAPGYGGHASGRGFRGRGAAGLRGGRGLAVINEISKRMIRQRMPEISIPNFGLHPPFHMNRMFSTIDEAKQYSSEIYLSHLAYPLEGHVEMANNPAIFAPGRPILNGAAMPGPSGVGGRPEIAFTAYPPPPNGAYAYSFQGKIPGFEHQNFYEPPFSMPHPGMHMGM